VTKEPLSYLRRPGIQEEHVLERREQMTFGDLGGLAREKLVPLTEVQNCFTTKDTKSTKGLKALLIGRLQQA
jgi:hypothetical protein